MNRQSDPYLTAPEIAAKLRCSKAQAKVHGTQCRIVPLSDGTKPATRMSDLSGPPLSSDRDLGEEILVAVEIAVELRCSPAQVHKLMNGTVKGSTKLPFIRNGRKKVVRRSTFEAWKRQNESGGGE
jgi:hypothetical protein